jgi:BirA family transcriptional regulator, biotin operon repressor / biotin---[acetyl-CoA-carboxylase] ligase
MPPPPRSAWPEVAHPPIETYDALDSTNAEARRRAEAGEAGPVWITARRQSAGRGRRGRNWSTGEGNLAATLLMTSAKPPGEAAQISFVAALAVADLAEACLGPGAATLKWPNDLLARGEKAAGILVESGARADGGLWLAVGIGVNLASAPADLPATAFAEHMARAPAPGEALEILAQAFERRRQVWEAQGFAPIAAAWTERAHGLGQPCVARLLAEDLHGIAEGLEIDGALRLRLADGSVARITAGDVFFGEA